MCICDSNTGINFLFPAKTSNWDVVYKLRKPEAVNKKCMDWLEMYIGAKYVKRKSKMVYSWYLFFLGFLSLRFGLFLSPFHEFIYSSIFTIFSVFLLLFFKPLLHVFVFSFIYFPSFPYFTHCFIYV